nr:hypothetical protein [Tanacetum cinerariifolium]
MASLADKAILSESVEQGPLIWPSVEVEGVTRLKKYLELSAAKAIQADCDVKATNIILQGLPPEHPEVSFIQPSSNKPLQAPHDPPGL